jgi:hypothetical protein
MRHIFISYSRTDREAVDGIVARLEQDGFHVWIDREELRPGELWQEAIVQAVDNAYAFVLMLSRDAAASDNVRREVDLAEEANKELVPVLLTPVELPVKLRYQLAGIEWIEYYRDPEVKYGELVEALHAHQKTFFGYETPKIPDVEQLLAGNLKIPVFGSEKEEEYLN